MKKEGSRKNLGSFYFFSRLPHLYHNFSNYIFLNFPRYLGSFRLFLFLSLPNQLCLPVPYAPSHSSTLLFSLVSIPLLLYDFYNNLATFIIIIISSFSFSLTFPSIPYLMRAKKSYKRRTNYSHSINVYLSYYTKTISN